MIIAHRLSTVMDCDKIIVLKFGEIVEQGSHDELLKKNGYYASLWNKQSEQNKKMQQEAEDKKKDKIEFDKATLKGKTQK